MNNINQYERERERALFKIEFNKENENQFDTSYRRRCARPTQLVYIRKRSV